MANANVIIIQGELASPLRLSTDENGGNERADFKIIVTQAKPSRSNPHGTQQFEVLCRVLGGAVEKLKDKNIGDQVLLDGKMRTSPTKISYVEAHKVD